jgi:FRG domain
MQQAAIEIVTHDLAGQPFTADSFLEYLRPSHDRWHEVRNHFEPKMPMYDYRDQWAFRGHWNSINWKLVPSAWRYESIKTHVDLSLELGMQNGFSNSEMDYRDYLQRTQNILLETFYESLVEHGHPVPSERIGPGLRPTVNRVEIVGLAQHHGIPTSLLDWTLNPLAAAYFSSAKHLRVGESDEICVWCLNLRSAMVLDESKSTGISEIACIKVIKQAAHTNSYLKAQKGLFTETIKGQFNEKSGPDIESVVTDASQNIEQRTASYAFPVLRKIVLKISEVERLLLLLEREGYSRSLLMPTLDNLAKDALERSLRRGQ